MYVCNCNGISDRGVKTAIRAGAEGWEEVHEHHGCTPCCGRCEAEITEEIAKQRAEQPAKAVALLRIPDMMAVS